MIIVINIRPDGSIQWANSVPKYQTATNAQSERFVSFANANIGDKIYFIFNEERSVLEGNNKLFKNQNQNALALAELNKRGELSISMIGGNEDLKSVIVPTLTKQISKNQFLVFGLERNKFRIGRVELN